MNSTKISIVTLAVVMAAATLAAPTTSAQRLEDSPGFLDVTIFESWFDEEPKIEVNIRGALMRLVAEASRLEDPDLAEVLRELRAIHVRGFNSNETIFPDVRRRISGVSRDLEGRGWETVVRVREETESVTMMIKTNGDTISGMIVMVAEPDETVFINIVGDIDPEDVGRLGRRLNVDKLDRDW